MDQVIEGVAKDREVLERLVVETVLLKGAGGDLNDSGNDRGDTVDRQDAIRVQETVGKRSAWWRRRIGQLAG